MPMQSAMTGRRHGQILEAENLLVVLTDEQKHENHTSQNQVTSYAKKFSLLEILKNRRS